MPSNKTYFSAKERRTLADEGEALPDGSFPIRNKQDLRDAIKSWGLAKNKSRAKTWIMKRAKELGAESMLPEDWDNIEKGKDLAKLVKKKITDKRGHMQTVWVKPDDQTVGGKWRRDKELKATPKELKFNPKLTEGQATHLYETAKPLSYANTPHNKKMMAKVVDNHLKKLRAERTTEGEGKKNLKANDIPLGTTLTHKRTGAKVKVWNVDPHLGKMQLERDGKKHTVWVSAKDWEMDSKKKTVSH